MRKTEYINEFDDNILCYEGEEWREVTWANTLTEVSSFGRVRSSPYGHSAIRKLRFTDCGRLAIDIMMPGGKKKACMVNRLVAEFFLPPPNNPDKIYVSYKDFNAHNNRVENLEWISKEEWKIKFKDELQAQVKMLHQKSKVVKLNLQLARIIRKMHAQGISNQEIAEGFGVTAMQISRVVRQENWAEPKTSSEQS